MEEEKKTKSRAEIARSSLKCIESTASNARNELNKRKGKTPGNIANINQFNNDKPQRNLNENSRLIRKQLEALCREPVISRINFVDENQRENTVFITRHGPVDNSERNPKIISYHSIFGRISELDVGQDGVFTYDGKEGELIVKSKTVLFPVYKNEIWDSEDTQFDIEGFGKATIKSLREFLETRTLEKDDEFDEAWKEESDQNIIEGVRRSLLTQMGLRDQPILDQYQGEIFRMPIASRCFLSGPPGTGKTTTLIRRLGQKTDRQALEESENDMKLIRSVEAETGCLHEESWIFFSPNELLRLYAKEAFNKERLAASDENVRTWDKFRDELARDKLKLLRTATRRSGFKDVGNDDHIKSDSMDDAEWYDSLSTFLKNSFAEELSSDVSFLADHDDESIIEIGGLLEGKFSEIKSNFYASASQNVENVIDKIREVIASQEKNINGILARERNILTSNDRNFPEQLREEVSNQLAAGNQVADEREELQAVLDDESEQDVDSQFGFKITLKQTLFHYERAIKSLALAQLENRRVPKNSKSDMLLSWLGPERTPSNDDLDRLAKLLTDQLKLKKLMRLERLFLGNISSRYKRFRSEMVKSKRWYNSEPNGGSGLHWRELDLVILAILQIGNELMSHYRISTRQTPNFEMLTTIVHSQKAQILIDEATDFSRIQLACMNELSHPASGSLFLCGDVNQRLTEWGLKSSKALDWIKPEITHRSIKVSYRQSGRLIELAKDIAVIGGSQTGDINLPDRLDMEGLAPAWKTNLNDDESIAEWIAQRIEEIDFILKRATTIAVLVNQESQVEPLALKLSEYLKKIHLTAVACKNGNVVGNDRDVRVFNLRHIKGLEFEAVFFVNLDQTITQHPELFSKYLYVGATRAATYLGVTLSGEIPQEIDSLKRHFGPDWSLSMRPS